jgi:hypothetical protein
MIDLVKYLACYEFEETLPGSGKKIKIRPYSAADLKKLLLSTDEETALDDLIQACVLSENFNVDELYLQDRQFLLITLRKLTKGTTYNYTFTCPTCNSQRIIIVDLKKIKVKELSKKNSNTVKLDDNISLELKPITRGSIKEATKIIDEKEKQNQADLGESRPLEQVMLIYALNIVKFITPEGEYSPSKEEAIDFINNEKLPRWMFEKITDWFKNLDYGMDLTIKVSCDNKKCASFEKEIKEDLQLGDFLF